MHRRSQCVTDLEHWTYENRDMGSHTKMSLARQLQVRDNLSDAVRDQVWALPRATLLESLARGPAAVPIAVGKAAAKAKGKAKPKAKAKAKAKG